MKTTKELIIADITAKVEAKLASQKVELNIAENVVKTFDSYLKSLQVVVDLEDAVKKNVFDFNKKVDNIKKKFSEIEKGEYLKTYTLITQKAKELGIAPNAVPGLIEMDKKYFAYKEFTNRLQTIKIN